MKTLLQQSFGDQRDDNCLLRDLMSAKPHKNETTSYGFGLRIQDIRSLLLNRIKIYEADVKTRKIKTAIYDQCAVDVHLTRLSGQIGMAVRLQKPENQIRHK